MSQQRTTVTRLTSTAPAAIAVIELRGPQAIDLMHRHWSPHQGSSDLAINRIRYGVFRSNPTDTASIGESIIVVRRGQDHFELHCHGGQAAALSILRPLLDAGAEQIPHSAWIAREVLGHMAAEATEDMILATTVRTASILMDQVRGALDSELERIEHCAEQGRWAEARGAAEDVLKWSDVGMHLIHPWRVVLCGPPNVGKSSLLNRLLGYSRALVHAQAGTTRDLLSESTSIDGWPVTLIDSAGIRRSEHQVESLGIQRAKQAIDSADRLLLLIDPLEGWTTEHETIWRAKSEKCLLVQTKADLPTAVVTMPVQPGMPSPTDAPYRVSAVRGDGMVALMEAISRSLVAEPPPVGAAIPFRSAHIERLASYLQSGSGFQ